MGLRGRAAWAVLVGLALTSCVLLPDRGGEGGALQGTRWELVTLEGVAPIEGTSITLAFVDATIEGSAGCNTYGGSYALTDGNLELDGIYATEMGCMEPEGVLDQEQSYLGVLRAVAAHELGADWLTLVDKAGTKLATYVPEGDASLDPAVPEPAAPNPTETATPSPTAVPPTATAVPQIPDGWVRHIDQETGISLALPETWVVDAPDPAGQVTIVQSFPKDSYVGGEPFRPGDTKCDLWIHPLKTRAATLISSYDTDPDGTILSMEEVVLDSGEVGTRIEAEGMGVSLSLITEVYGRAVTFVCYGDLTPFDGISLTLAGDE